jgi:hypothetical protein
LEENVSEETTLNDENTNLRDERDQLRDNREQLVVDRIDELQTNLNEIKSSDVLRQVQDLQEQLLLVEMENVNEMITPNDENEKGVGTVQLRDEREQLVDHIDKLQADLNEIKSSDMILQLQDLQEELQLLLGRDENQNLRDERLTQAQPNRHEPNPTSSMPESSGISKSRKKAGRTANRGWPGRQARSTIPNPTSSTRESLRTSKSRKKAGMRLRRSRTARSKPTPTQTSDYSRTNRT